ncbi:hypothetical protein J5O04_03160 [Corynebacterium hindlerae]|uniref:hypothetical protein n=1 Tax=Corynebacterium hindlerae TaxID=699041 RepID=UPI001AD749B3|nr:hypothetical protein [Corynebacterium hindlerae]QTH60146.1 hypothetical protein J5O04_03160 [Corynebacterium hindlerae]
MKNRTDASWWRFPSPELFAFISLWVALLMPWSEIEGWAFLLMLGTTLAFFCSFVLGLTRPTRWVPSTAVLVLGLALLSATFAPSHGDPDFGRGWLLISGFGLTFSGVSDLIRRCLAMWKYRQTTPKSRRRNP